GDPCAFGTGALFELHVLSLSDLYSVGNWLHAHLQPPLPMKNKLRELRAAREWSQSDLADKLGVSRQTVNAIETERYDPSLPLAFKVSQLFKMPIEEIFEPEKN